MRKMMRSGAVLLVLLAVAGSPWHVSGSGGTAAPTAPSSLPDNVLHHLLHVEPNMQLQILGNVSDLEGTLKRTFLFPGHRRAATMLQRWMTEAGMTSWIDAVGNVRGRAPAAHPGAPALVAGSHYDTVADGGRFDGALGVITAVAAVKAKLLEAALDSGVLSASELAEAVAELSTNVRAGARPGGLPTRLDVRQLLGAAGSAVTLARPVEVAAFSDEEGIRFQSTFLGSRALAGTLAGSGLLEARDAAGLTLVQALEEAGMDASEEGLRSAALRPAQVAAYVEVHMEQGPALEAAGRALGVVRAIAGQVRLTATVSGEQGHAGTVPMAMRRDPLTAAAELVLHLERTCGGGRGVGGAHGNTAGQLQVAAPGVSPLVQEDASAPENGEGVQSSGGDLASGADDKEEARSGLVCTVGSLNVWPNAGNVIPGRVNFTVDVRSSNDTEWRGVVVELRMFMERECARRGVDCTLEVRHEAAAVQAAPEVVAQLVAAAEESGADYARVEAWQRRAERAGGRRPLPRGEVSVAPQAAVGACAAGEEVGDDAAAQACSAEGADAPPAADAAATAAAQVAAPSGACAPLLVSGAGHDAMAMANLTRMGMLFVRCRGGVSHSPAEYVAPDDVAAGTAALLRFMSAWVAADDA